VEEFARAQVELNRANQGRVVAHRRGLDPLLAKGLVDVMIDDLRDRRSDAS